MSPNDIRLRLTVRRHGLPELKLVWPCTVSDDLTVASLLTDINKVVTLENGDWGLEDYAVELSDAQGGSFECLHFQQIGKIFKHDDQVLIRSLLTEDIRRRRISGRHQISNSGIHLVDGIPFGRNRGPRDRPILALPPRKRARITYGEDDDDEEDEEDDAEPLRRNQLLLGEGAPAIMDGPVNYLDVSSDDDDDQDFVSADPGSDSDEDLHHNEEGPDGDLFNADGHLDEEVRLLQADNDIIGDEMHNDVDDIRFQQATSKPLLKPESQPLMGGIAPTAIECLQSAFPSTAPNYIEAELQQHNMDIRRAYHELSETYDATLSFDDVLDKFLTARFQPQAEPPALLPEAPKAPAKPLIQVVESDGEAATPAIISEVQDENSEHDSDENSSDGGSDSSSDASDDGSDADEIDSSSDDSSDSDDTSQNAASEAENGGPNSGVQSSKDSDDTDKDSEASEEWEGLSTPGHTRQSAEQAAESDDSSSDSSSSDSDSESDSDSGPEDISSRVAVVPQALPVQPSKGVDSSEGPTVGRGQGLSKTQKRNARRKLAKKMRSVEDDQGPLHQTESPSIQDDLDARRQALLNAIADEPEESEERPRRPLIQEVEMEEPEATTPDIPALSTDDTPVAAEPIITEERPKELGSTTSSTDDSGRRRMRVDMGAGRRLLFGALGLKNPKSKSDEDKLKEGLMKDVRPLKNHRLDEPAEAETAPEVEPVDDDSWREKITYRAVECCHDDMVLSEPPFPFVQRWDPQQHFGAMKKRKRNSQNYAQDDYYYYDDDSYWHGEGEDEDFDARQSKKSKKSKKKSGANKEQELTEPNPELELNYDDAPTKEQALDSQATDLDDLPSLPTDVSSLPALQLDDAKPGMVITWKEFRLSKATNWQPESHFVTGMMISKDANKMHLILAKRDREQDDKLYDEETGERIYDKFEVPDNSDDEDDGEDDGHRDLSWTEMMDPRLVQEEPSPSLLNSPASKGFQLESEAGEGGLDTGRPPMDSSITDGTSMQVTGGIDPELDLSTGKINEVQDSPSIPSGQNYPHPYPTAPSIGGPSYSDTSKGDASQGGCGDAEVVIKDSQPAALRDGLVNNTETESAHDGLLGQESDDEVVDGTGSDGARDALAVTVMSASPEAEGKEQTSAVEHPQLQMPSSIASIDSGRQPDVNVTANDTELAGMEASNNTPMNSTPKRIDGGILEDANSHKSSSPPFPMIDEIWHTAQTSKKTRSPPKSSQLSVLGERKKNAKSEYEEAMRKLDQGEESDRSLDKNKSKSIRNLFPNATQPARLETEGSPAPLGRTPSGRKKNNKSSPFQVPTDSQVIALSSDDESSQSPSPAPVEHYAEDEIDETYEHRGSLLPQDRGWVKKTRSSSGGATEPGTRSRGKSMPAAVSDGSIKKNMIPISGSGAAGGGNGRRRMSKKF